MLRQKQHVLYELDQERFSWRGIKLLALLYFGSIIAGAIFGLIAFRLTHHFDPDASSYLAGKPYPKFFDRARWICVLVILPYLFTSCRVTSFKAIGFKSPFPATFSKWFGYGVVMIFMIYGFNLLIGAFSYRASWLNPELGIDLGEAMLAAMLIACLEEIVFRGLVFRIFYTAFKPIASILLSSAFFAILHFKSPEAALESLAPSDVGLAEATHIAVSSIASIVTEFDLTYLLAIFLVGIVLHQVFLLGNNLWASIAIHAGWVFTIKFFGKAFETGEHANLFSGTTKVADGYWVSIVLLVFIGFFAYLLRRNDSLCSQAKSP